MRFLTPVQYRHMFELAELEIVDECPKGAPGKPITDHDWYIPEPVPSPLKLNRKTELVLKGQLKRQSYQAGQVWIQGLVFLSATTNIGVRGPATRYRLR